MIQNLIELAIQLSLPWLPVETLLAISQVNKKFYRHGQNQIWRDRIKHEFPQEDLTWVATDTPGIYKYLYFQYRAEGYTSKFPREDVQKVLSLIKDRNLPEIKKLDLFTEILTKEKNKREKIFITDSNQRSVFYWARGCFEIQRYLFESAKEKVFSKEKNYFNISKEFSNTNTILDVAIKCHIPWAEIIALIEQDVENSNKMLSEKVIFNLYISASKEDHVEAVKEIDKQYPKFKHHTDEYGQTSYLWAGALGSSATLEYLASQGVNREVKTVNPSREEHHGRSALDWALFYRSSTVAMLYRFDNSIPNKKRAFLEAAKNGMIFFKVLDKKYEEELISFYPEAINLASAYNRVNILTYLMTEKNIQLGRININAKDSTGLTAVNYAAANGCREALSFLLNNKADPAVKSPNDETLLHVASKNNHYEIVIEVLNRDSDSINEVTVLNETAVFLAAKNFNLKIVKKLLEIKSIDINIAELGDNFTPLNIIVFSMDNKKRNNKDAIEIIELLIKSGADCYCKSDGFAPIHYAVKNNLFRVVQILHQKNQKILDLLSEANNQSKTPRTPLALAMYLKHLFMTMYLQTLQINSVTPSLLQEIVFSSGSVLPTVLIKYFPTYNAAIEGHVCFEESTTLEGLLFLSSLECYFPSFIIDCFNNNYFQFIFHLSIVDKSGFVLKAVEQYLKTVEQYTNLAIKQDMASSLNILLNSGMQFTPLMKEKANSLIEAISLPNSEALYSKQNVIPIDEELTFEPACCIV